MKRTTCIIVEDEPASQEILQRYVSDVPSLDLVSVCSNAFEATNVLQTSKIDVMFLDINMPRLSGLEFYKSLSSPPKVIFTTAYPEFAVSGFEVNALDYLVKPFTFERFVKAVNRFTEGVKSERKEEQYIVVMADKKMHRLRCEDILFVEGMGDYVKIHVQDKTLVVHQTLQKIQDMLPVERFRRIHKSFIIAVSRLEYVEGNMAVINKVKLPIGQTYRAEFLSFLNQP